MWVAARSLGRRWVELVVDPSCAGNLIVNGLGVARPFRARRACLSSRWRCRLSAAGQVSWPRDPRTAGRWPGLPGRAARSRCRGTGGAQGPGRPAWLSGGLPGRRAATCGTVSARSGVTPSAGRPRRNHRPPARSGWPAAADPTAPARWCAIPAGTSRQALRRGSPLRPTARRAAPRRTPPGRLRRSLRATLAGRGRQGGRAAASEARASSAATATWAISVIASSCASGTIVSAKPSVSRSNAPPSRAAPRNSRRLAQARSLAWNTALVILHTPPSVGSYLRSYTLSSSRATPAQPSPYGQRSEFGGRSLLPVATTPGTRRPTGTLRNGTCAH